MHIQLINLGDPTCGFGNDIASAEENALVWGAAINAPVTVVGTDPVYHTTYGFNSSVAQNVSNQAVNFALSKPGTAGAYLSLSCYFASVPPDWNIPFLSQALGGTWAVNGIINCGDSGHLEESVASQFPGFLAQLSESDLANWDCSVHEAFSA